MNINISSTDFLVNLNAYNNILKQELEKGITPSKYEDDLIKLNKDELLFLHIKSINEKVLLLNRVDKKYLFQKNTIEKTPKNKPKIIPVEAFITNQKIYIKSDKVKTITLTNIYQIDIREKSVIIYDEIKGSNSHRKTELLINSLDIKLRLILLLEMLPKLPITDDFAGKNVTLGIQINKN